MSLTCLSCNVVFSVPELHQEHYKSDWHRYNLKRRLAELPSITKEEFEKRAESTKEIQGNDKRLSLRCDVCNKHFSTENAKNNHLKSKKHLDSLSEFAKDKDKKSSKEVRIDDKKASKVGACSDDKKIDKPKAVENDMDIDDDDDGEWESCDDSDDDEKVITEGTLTVETNDCLFCNHQSQSTEDNVTHMKEVHSFFIPEREKLVHLDKFIGFLAVKIHFGICLWCNGRGKQFRTVESLKKHMIDKGHCKILFEGKAKSAYKRFYQEEDIDAEEFEEIGEFDEAEEYDEMEEYDGSDEEEGSIEKLLKDADFEVNYHLEQFLGIVH
ncbi:Cytoplasmic 60S subunit biogenesis factor like protein [Argiope bruennichi]|uniref:Cytoplasmic 60S subunit biogenesis factor like protein n=1 Tax=Argiope bruennichi TaxID=94029 RepID=A0A8T0F724_ARGBR|nr:Cytoplasmic 60S subunit biogenesis factor like protein [Argiope bruennichi]